MVSAFVFAQVAGANVNISQIHTALHAIEGVKTVHFVAGPTDIILFVETNDQPALMAAVGKIRSVQGVASTDTRIVLPI
jgi:nitrate reductase NapAB chaperone NapD